MIRELKFESPLGCWTLKLAAPPPDLALFVETFWEVHGFANMTRERILPKTSIELMFNLGPPHRVVDTDSNRDTLHRDAWVAGLQGRPLVVEPAFDMRRNPSHLIAVRLRPAGAYAFFGSPMDEISNRVIDLDAIVGERVAATQRRLVDSDSSATRFGLLEQLMRERVNGGTSLRPFVAFAASQIERSQGALRIRDLCRELGVSRKHLGLWFRQQVGIAPKQYAGIARFQRLVAALSGAAPANLATLAQNLGYFDQAHLHHDCQAFSAMAPAALRRTLSPDGIATIEC